MQHDNLGSHPSPLGHVPRWRDFHHGGRVYRARLDVRALSRRKPDPRIRVVWVSRLLPPPEDRPLAGWTVHIWCLGQVLDGSDELRGKLGLVADFCSLTRMAAVQRTRRWLDTAHPAVQFIRSRSVPTWTLRMVRDALGWERAK